MKSSETVRNAAKLLVTKYRDPNTGYRDKDAAMGDPAIQAALKEVDWKQLVTQSYFYWRAQTMNTGTKETKHSRPYMVSRMLQCPICHQQIENRKMGNHVRHEHPGQLIGQRTPRLRVGERRALAVNHTNGVPPPASYDLAAALRDHPRCAKCGADILSQTMALLAANNLR